ncbi:MAG TPA: hypothetical protein VJ476_02265 [Rhizomicrobium sp.]|nr:hypothetical protein [Rhizomicrobium sp.]
MPEILERNKRGFGIGYWLVVAVGMAVLAAYLAASCALKVFC